jgi:hypothetical protein
MANKPETTKARAAILTYQQPATNKGRLKKEHVAGSPTTQERGGQVIRRSKGLKMAPVGEPSEPEPSLDAPLVTFHSSLSPAATTGLSVKSSGTGTKKVPSDRRAQQRPYFDVRAEATAEPSRLMNARPHCVEEIANFHR